MLKDFTNGSRPLWWVPDPHVRSLYPLGRSRTSTYTNCPPPPPYGSGPFRIGPEPPTRAPSALGQNMP
jgi:hypothetical protein